jgi:hypothetical protein
MSLSLSLAIMTSCIGAATERRGPGDHESSPTRCLGEPEHQRTRTERDRECPVANGKPDSVRTRALNAYRVGSKVRLKR